MSGGARTDSPTGENAPDRFRGMNRAKNAHSAMTAEAFQHIDGENPFEEFGPGIAALVAGGFGLRGQFRGGGRGVQVRKGPSAVRQLSSFDGTLVRWTRIQ